MIATLAIGLLAGAILAARSESAARYPFTQTGDDFLSRVMSDGSDVVQPLIDDHGNWFWADDTLNLVVVVLEGPKDGMVGPILTRRGAALFRVGTYAENQFVKVLGQRDRVVLIKQNGQQICFPASMGATRIIKQLHAGQSQVPSAGSLVTPALQQIAPDYDKVWVAFQDVRDDRRRRKDKD